LERTAATPRRAWASWITAFYVAVSAIWIIVSDRLVLVLPDEVAHRTHSLKALLYILLTSLLLSLLARRAISFLQTGRALVQSLVDSAPFAIIAVDLSGRVRLWNPEAESLFGWKAREVLGQPNPIVPEEFKAEFDAHLSRTVGGVAFRRKSLRRRCRDGSMIDLDFSNSPIRDGRGRVVGTMGLFADASRRNQMQRDLRLQAAALEATASAVVLADAELIVQWTNRAFGKLTGYDAEETPGKRLPELLWGRANDAEVGRLEAALTAGESLHSRGVHRRKNGTSFLAELTVSPIRDDVGQTTHVVAVQEDVSETAFLSEQLRFLASYDKLTQLPNRAHFLEMIAQMVVSLRSDQELALVVARIDRIHRVRQSLGRSSADELVRTVGERLRRVAGGDLELAAFGGGLFALARVAPQVESELPRVLQRLRAAAELPITISGSDLLPRVTFGCALFPRDGATHDIVLQRAETALSWAFDEGDPLRFFEDSLQTSLDERLSLGGELPTAMGHADLFLEYQPIFDLNDGTVAMAEALVRWRHPRHGVLLPGRFLPAAEEAGLSVRLDEWVLRTAVAHCRSGLGEQVGAVAVNCGARTLEHEGLVRCLRKMARSGEVDPGRVILEITESDAMRSPERTIDVLERIRELGYRVAIDDFGVAYSSLNYLRRLPADFLKIDRSFIAGVGAIRRDERLVEVILGLAEDYDIQVIAEGVEEPAQLEWLQRRGCLYVQGFLLGRPGAADEMPSSLPISPSRSSNGASGSASSGSRWRE
jgi:PAS domain S-box-containing protein/diguanylate cyclase (GGDEF)-like protein